MECTYEYNPGADTIEVTTNGTADAEKLVEMVRHIAAMCAERPSANVLVDHSRLKAGKLTMDGVRTASNATVSLKNVTGKRKCAHVVENDLQYGLVRAWEMLVEVSGYPELEMRVFRARTEALEWWNANEYQYGREKC